MSAIPLLNMKGERVGELQLADQQLVLNRGAQAVHDAVVAHLATRRAGTAKTKKRGEVSGGGIKPYKQKGTGRARAGSIRSPIWRGGGVVFGPQPRDYTKKMTKKAAQLAFGRAFSEKVAAGQVVAVDRVELPEPKTRYVQGLLESLKASKGALLVLGAADGHVSRATRNIRNASVTTADALHTYQVLSFPLLVLDRAAMQRIEQRLAQTAGGAS